MANRIPASGSTPRVQVWRDVDSERRRFGGCLRARGAEVYIGRRLYRMRWGR